MKATQTDGKFDENYKRGELEKSTFNTRHSGVTTDSQSKSVYMLEDRKFFIRKKLLLPPGRRHTQFEEFLAQQHLEEQLEFLAFSDFTGILLFFSDSSNLSMGLFKKGCLIELIQLVKGVLKINLPNNGRSVFAYSEQKPRVYQVKWHIAKAYWELLKAEEIATPLKATITNMVFLTQRYKKAKITCGMELKLGVPGINYIFLFENGYPVGTYRIEKESGRLHHCQTPTLLPVPEDDSVFYIYASRNL